MANRILAALAVLLAMATSSQVQAVQITGFSPTSPQAHQPIVVNVALLGSERVDSVRVNQHGAVLSLFLEGNDVVLPGVPPPPPLQDRVESYAIGALPAGAYTLELYYGGPTATLIQTVPLGVAAATPVPGLDTRGLMLLALLVGGIGCVLVARAAHRSS